MQQRIIVKVPMKKEKDKSKAMKVAVGIIGVSSVKIGTGGDGDNLIVIGKEIDAFSLTKVLIKKLGRATLVRVEPFINGYNNRFDHEQNLQLHQDQASNTYMLYDGQLNGYNNSYPQPIYQFNTPPPPSPYHYYSYDQKPVYNNDSDCSIM